MCPPSRGLVCIRWFSDDALERRKAMAASRSNPVESGAAIPEKEYPVPSTAGSAAWSREIATRDRARVLSRLLEQTPIIPAVRSSEFLTDAAQAPGKVVYFLFGNPEEIGDMVHTVVTAGKVPIVNLDLVSGFARDRAAISVSVRVETCRELSRLTPNRCEPHATSDYLQSSVRFSWIRRRCITRYEVWTSFCLTHSKFSPPWQHRT